MTYLFGRARSRKLPSASVGNASLFNTLALLNSGAHSAIRRFGIAGLCAPIHFYRRFLSPLAPPTCRFQPTCSVYALEAIKTHGPLGGGLLAVRRLLRCHPITWLGGASGLDPVPHPRHRRP